MHRPRIELVLDDTEVTPPVQAALKQINAQVITTPLTPAPNDVFTDLHQHYHSFDARLILTADGTRLTHGRFKALLNRVDRQPCASLVLSEHSSELPAHTENAIGNRPIRFDTGLSQEELVGQLTAMCSMRRSFEELWQKLEDLRRQDEQLTATVRNLESQLREAAGIQQDLCRNKTPMIRGASVHTLYRPAGLICGDVYRVARLDDSNVSLSLADATGHGLPAAMLSLYVRRWLSQELDHRTHNTSEISFHPEQVLQELNRDLYEADLRDCHFVAGLYAVYNERTQTLQWARGGIPEPILLRPNEKPRILPSKGPLLGVCKYFDYSTVTLELLPGDTLLFYTDGLEAFLKNSNNKTDPGASGSACADIPYRSSVSNQTNCYAKSENVLESSNTLNRHTTINASCNASTFDAPYESWYIDWALRFADKPADSYLQELQQQMDQTHPNDWPVDDTTVLTLTVNHTVSQSVFRS